MRSLYYSIFILCILTACANLKKSAERSSVIMDSLVSNSKEQRLDSVTYTKTVVVKDTVVNVPARTIRDTLSVKELQPAYTQDGTSVKRSYVAETKGAHAFLNVLPDGKVEYGCNADSLSIVLQSLVRENTELHSRVDSVKDFIQIVNKNEKTVQRSSVIKTRSFLAATWPYLLAIAVVIVVVYFVKRFLKWPI